LLRNLKNLLKNARLRFPSRRMVAASPPFGGAMSWPLFSLGSLAFGQQKKRCLAFATRSLGLAFPFFRFSFYTPTRTFICVTRYPLELPKFHARNVLHHIHISFCLSFSFPIFAFFFGNTQSRKIWGWQLMPAPTTNSHNHKLAYVCAHEYICRSHV